jgi:FAD/FMN-containing dehydrogenase
VIVRDGSWRELGRAVAGEVLRPGDAAYETARRPAIARFRDARPAAVVRCRTPADVAAAIVFARRAGLPLAARSGGHCFAGGSSTDGIVVDVGPMDAVAVGDGVATVGAGTRLGALYDALDADGLTIPAGCGPRVGIAGLVLGGGVGILGRAHGLTCDALVGAEVVLADGSVVTCDADRDADLFWALRGAGAGGFGIVTELRFRTLAAPPATRVQAVWPAEAAADVVAAWQRWSPGAPDEMAASMLVSAPADPGAPPVVVVAGAFAGPDVEARTLLDGLAAAVGTPPSSLVLAPASLRETKRALADTGGEPDPLERDLVVSRSEFLAVPLPADAVEALVAHLAADRRPGEDRELDFAPWGGAYARVSADATAFVHRDARVLLKHAVALDIDAGAADVAAGREWLERSFAIVHPFGTGGVYPNFPETDLDDRARAYHGGNLERLVAIRGRYDPDDVFAGPQAIPHIG